MRTKELFQDDNDKVYLRIQKEKEEDIEESIIMKVSGSGDTVSHTSMTDRLKTELFNQFKKSLENVPFNEPVECPCCKGTITTYKRSLNKGQVYFLIELFNLYKSTKSIWHRFNDVQILVEDKYNRRCTDYTKLKSWNLLKSKGDVRHDGNSSGMFAVTQFAVKFLHGEVTVPKFLVQDNNGHTLSESTEHVSVHSFNIEDFNYNQTVHGNKHLK